MYKRDFNYLVASKAVVLMLTLTLLSCGNENTSGKSSNNSANNGGPSTLITANNQQKLAQILPVLQQENPCIGGGQVSKVTLPITNVNVGIGSIHAGVTSYGDIAFIYNQATPAVDLYLCPRSQVSATPQLTNAPVLESAQFGCPIGQITASDILIPGNGVQYLLKFAPIHIPGTDRISTLCTQNIN